jgi:hypothetical protein
VDRILRALARPTNDASSHLRMVKFTDSSESVRRVVSLGTHQLVRQTPTARSANGTVGSIPLSGSAL